MKRTATFAFFLATLVTLTGCYHIGTPGNANIRLGKINVNNNTKEAKIRTYMIASLRERFSMDPAATLAKDPKTPSYNVAVNFKSMDNRSVARTKMREANSRDDDSDAYQSVLFRIVLTAKITVTADDDKTVILSKIYRGQGDLPNLHDRELPFQKACKQAVDSIANQLVDDLATAKN